MEETFHVFLLLRNREFRYAATKLAFMFLMHLKLMDGVLLYSLTLLMAMRILHKGTPSELFPEQEYLSVMLRGLFWQLY